MTEKDLAIQTLKAICNDKDSPATARASAARTLLELTGAIGRLQTERPNTEKALHEMTKDEIDLELIKCKAIVDSATVSSDTKQNKIVTRRKLAAKRRENRVKRAKSRPDWLT